MVSRGGLFDGLLARDALRGRMKALSERGQRLARDYHRRPQRRIKPPGQPPAASPHARPVTVKLVYHDRRHGAFATSVAALTHYLAKDGPLFDRDHVGLDGRAIIEAWSGDRRVFHVIVSPNDGARIADMVSYGRAVVAAWEDRLGPLDWAAAVERKPDMAHPDGNQHLHVMIRGVQDERDLFFDREVVKHWLRFDAVEVTTDRLGWMDARERQAYERQLTEMRRLREERGRDAGRDPLQELGGREL